MADYLVIYAPTSGNNQAIQGPNANKTFTAVSGDLANNAAAVQQDQDGKYVAFPLLGAIQASYTTNVGIANADLKFTALAAGNGGNSIRIRYAIAGNNTPLTVSVSTLDITINLATSAGGAATSTANQILAAVQASSPASALVTVALAPGNTGVGVPLVGFALTNLGGGTNGGCIASQITVALAANNNPTTF